MKNFLMDLVDLYQQKYNDTVRQGQNEPKSQTAYRLGAQFAYYDCLDLLESQLKVFGYDISELGEITPKLGTMVSGQGKE